MVLGLIASMIGLTAAAKLVTTFDVFLLFLVEGVFVLDCDRERTGDVGAMTDSMTVMGAVEGVLGVCPCAADPSPCVGVAADGVTLATA